MFQDPAQSGVVIVTLPEDMPTNETIELLDALRGELSLPVALLVINQVLPELFDAQERARLLEPRDLDRKSPGDEAIAAAVRRSIRERIQKESLVRLENLAVDSVRLPLLLSGADRPEALGQLSSEGHVLGDKPRGT
jgi:anion-transporting  ArsA/GET3 family ATPase